MPDAKAINPLTSLRFFAAMWVVLFHYWPNLGAALPPIVAKGYLGVELFFVLSGFILCHVYLDSFADGGFRYGSFLWARLARVYPLHLATLVGVGALALAALAAGRVIDPNILSWPSLPANLLLVQAWGFAPQAGWNHPSWSISAEWFAYLSFPLFAWLALRFAGRPKLAAAGAYAFLVLVYAAFERLAGSPLTHATIAWGALRIVPCFAFGAALNLVWREIAASRRMTALAGAAISGAGVVLGAQFGAPDAILVGLFGCLILSLAALTKAGENSGGGAFFVYLGEISYSVYMICIPWKLLFVNGVAQAMHIDKAHMPLWAWMILLAGVVPLAAASYHLVEWPARRWMRRLAAPRPAALTSVA
ncbi:MAG TPA: acyltransferase [Caulobacteraceae bacterium]|nr:acyltransferase [Caulobacteraceae bacterium]